VRNIGAMILTRENRSTPRETCPIATMSTINIVQNRSGGGGLTIRSDQTANKCLSHIKAQSLKEN